MELDTICAILAIFREVEQPSCRMGPSPRVRKSLVMSMKAIFDRILDLMTVIALILLGIVAVIFIIAFIVVYIAGQA